MSTSSVYLNIQQVADLISVDPKTISRWSRSDPTMPVIRRGKIVRFRADLLQDWLDQQLPRAARARAQRTRSTQDSQLSASA